MLFRNGKNCGGAFSREKTNGKTNFFAKGRAVYRVAASLRLAAINLNFTDL
jgi:hypothetical protein